MFRNGPEVDGGGTAYLGPTTIIEMTIPMSQSSSDATLDDSWVLAGPIMYLFWDFVGLYIYRLSLIAVALLKGWIKACLGNVSGLYLAFIRAPMVSLLICNCRGIEWWLSWCLVFVQVGSSWMRVIILPINCPPYFEAVLTCNDDLENMRSLFARMRLLVFLLSPNLRWSGGAVLVCSYPFVQKGLGLYGPIIHYWVLRKRARQTLFVSVFPGCFAANLL